jgi:DsbC/DsbD-like thiol-disulfide interchange protein
MLVVLLLLGQLINADASKPLETSHLTVRLSASSPVVKPGGRISLYLDISPKPKMHVYSPEQKDLIPIALTLAPDRAYQALPPVFPKPEKYFFAPLKETQLVYSKPFRIAQDVTLSSAKALREAGHAAGSSLTITGKLRYQACDDAICYLPKSVPVSWTIKIDAAPMK